MAFVRLFANVPLNNTYKNIIRFPNAEERISYFMNYEISYGEQPELNFTCKDRTWKSAHVVINANQFDTFLSDVITANYVIVNFDYGDDYYLVAPFKQGFYFVNDFQIKNQNTCILNLELDVASTYALGSGVILDGQLMTKRKHCNRFNDMTYGYGSYKTNLFDEKYSNNGDVLDAIFDASYPVKVYEYKQNTNPYREPFNIEGDSHITRDEVIEYIQKYEWEMLITTEPINNSLSYIRYPTNYRIGDITTGNIQDEQYSKSIKYSETRLFNEKTDISSSVYVYVYPKYDNSILMSTMDDIYNNIESLKLPLVLVPNGMNYVTFLKEPKIENIASIVTRLLIPHNFVYSLIGRYATKVDFRIPWLRGTTESHLEYRDVKNYITFTFLDEKEDKIMNNVVVNAQENDSTIKRTTKFIDNYAYAIQLQLTSVDYANDDCWSYEDEYETFYKYNLADLSVNNLKDINLEPRLFKPPYSKHILKSLLSTSEGFEINPLVSGAQIKVISKFVPSPGLLRFSYFPKSYLASSPYNMLSKINVGNISTMDYSLPIKTDKWSEYIAERKNYAISGLVTPVALNTGVPVLTSLINSIGFGSTIPGLIVGLSNSMQAISNYITTKDNLSNAPDSVKNVGNDALSDFGLNNSLNPYVVVYELNDLQKEQVYDYYYRFGYQVNEFNKWDDLFTRQRFNYIELSDDELYHKIKFNQDSEFTGVIREGIPSDIRNIITNIFTKGVTIWEYKYSDMSLEYENLEIGIGSDD